MNKAKRIAEARISASKSYLKKEHLRETIQALIIERVSGGTIHDEVSLAQTFSDIDLVAMTLKMIPLDVWKNMAGKK